MLRCLCMHYCPNVIITQTSLHSDDSFPLFPRITESTNSITTYIVDEAQCKHKQYNRHVICD